MSEFIPETWLRLLDTSSTVRQLIASAALILALVLVTRLLRIVIGRSVSDAVVRQRYWDLTRTLFLILAGMLLVGLWLEEVKTVGLLLTGLLAAALIAMKEVFLGLAGRLMLAVVEPYRIGDRITVNGVSGQVMAIGLLYTWLLEVDGAQGEGDHSGRTAVIPHLWLTLHTVRNGTRHHDVVWNDLELTFPLWVDHRRVKNLIEGVAIECQRDWIARAQRRVQRVAVRYPGRFPAVAPAAGVSVRQFLPGEQVICVGLRFASEAWSVAETKSRLTDAILVALRAADIPLSSTSSPPEPPPPGERRLVGDRRVHEHPPGPIPEERRGGERRERRAPVPPPGEPGHPPEER